MKLPPVEVILSWPPANYINPVTRGPALIVVNAIFLSIATIVIILRVYSRLFVRKWWGWDDVFICLAYLSTVGVNVCIDLGVSDYHWDRHLWDIPLTTTASSLKVAYCAKILFLLAGFFTSCSLLSFYYRLIGDSGVRWFNYLLHASSVFNIIAWVPFMVCEIFTCTPIHAYWEFPTPASAKCLNEAACTLAGGIVKTFVDLLITTIPIPLILRMQMERRQRYAVIVLLSLGYLVTAAGAVRSYYTYRVFYNNYDLTWYQYPAFLAAAVENDVAIICACVPTLRPLLPHIFGGPITRIRAWYSSKSGSSANTTQNNSNNSSKPGTTLGFKTGIVDSNVHEASRSGSSSDTKLVIQRTESFELSSQVSTSGGDKGRITESRDREDVFSYNHFDPRMDFKGHDRRSTFHAY